MRIRPAVYTKALGALESNLTAIASGETSRAIAREVADDFGGRIQAQFQRGVDPYGKGWPQPKKGNPPGRDTENLMRNILVRAQGSRILLSSGGVAYGKYFARHALIFPTASLGLPPAWKAAAEKIARKYVARKLRGGR